MRKVMSIGIRDTTGGDTAALLPLLDALGYPTDEATLRARLDVMVATDPSARILVATSGNSVVGFACLHETPVPHRPTAVGRITAIAVLPDARGSGAGRALVEAAEAHFVARGIARIEVTSGDNHAAAHPFYLHLGYTNQGVRFAKALA
jgi:GNAT superfamily N-acetyltransferase